MTLKEISPFRWRYGDYIITQNWVTKPGNTPYPDSFTYCHEYYDGPEDNRCGYAQTLEEAVTLIEEKE